MVIVLNVGIRYVVVSTAVLIRISKALSSF